MNVVLKLLIGILLLASQSAAEEPFGESTRTPSMTNAPSPSPQSDTSLPTSNGLVAPQQCSGNSDEWDYSLRSKVDGGWWVQLIGCDDNRVACDYEGNIGLASDHCCKCKAECMGQCNDPVNTLKSSDNIFFIPGRHVSTDNDDSTDFGYTYRLLALVLVIFCCIGTGLRDVAYQRDLRATRQTMTQRRQQQRDSSGQVLSEEESKNARYELFVTKFHFQTVLPDKSNITAGRVRKSFTKQDEECPKEEETELELDGDDSTATPTSPRENDSGEIRFSQRLFSLRMPEAKDECCICLESYTKGETICAPITTSCNHLFHKDCIYEWIKTKDRCPLCRVELLKE